MQIIRAYQSVNRSLSSPGRLLTLTASMIFLCTACDGTLGQYGGDPDGEGPGADADVLPDNGMNAGSEDMGGDASSDGADLTDEADGSMGDLGVDPPDSGGGDDDMATTPSLDVPDYLVSGYNPNATFQNNQQDLFTCQGTTIPVEGITLSRFQRLESVEWVRNTGLFFGTRHTRATKRLPAEAERNPFEVSIKGGYSTWREQAQMDTSVISGHVDLMPYASQNWQDRVHMASKDSALDCMYDGATMPDRACVTAFAKQLLERGILFRPTTDEEVSLLVDHAIEDVLVNEAALGQTRKQSIELVYAAAQLTTSALFKSEWGTSDSPPQADGRRKLSNWELAHKIGYALKRRAPGAPALYIGYGGAGGVGNTWDLPSDERDLGHMSALYQAASDGSIQDPQVLADLIRQYAAGDDPERYDLPSEWRHHRARGRRATSWMSEGIMLFFREWLETPLLESSFKDTAYATSKHDDLDQFSGSAYWSRRGALKAIDSSYENIRTAPTYSYEPSILQQMDDTIARVVSADQDVLKTLLTTREFYTVTGDTDTAATNQYVPHFLYNFETPLSPLDSQTSRWLTMPANERAGILTHPAWLGAHSDNFEDGPAIVKRGYWIRKHLLCGDIPFPSAQIDLTLVTGDDFRARDRIYLSTEDPANPKTVMCQGCHALMNPLGYPFELYNHAGFMRFDDHGNPPDGSSTLAMFPQNSDLAQYNGVTIQSPMELTSILADSQHVKRCFVRHTFRYFMGRPETQADACTLSMMEQAYDIHNGSFIEMLVALMTSEAYTHTRTWDSTLAP